MARKRAFPRENTIGAALKKFATWFLRAIATLPFWCLGAIVTNVFWLRTFPIEDLLENPLLFTIISIICVLCISTGIQGVFLCTLVSESRERKRPRPEARSSDPIYVACGHAVVVGSYSEEAVQNIQIACRINQMTELGCSENCPYYFTPKPSGRSPIAGGFIGAAIGAPGGPIGAMIGGLIGALAGTAMESESAKSPLRREIERVQREGRSYRLIIHSL